ncbi:MAG: YeiH family protein [Chloroflexota bacterium]
MPAGTKSRILGILFTFAIAFAGMQLAKLPVLARVGAMITAILIAIVYRQLFGYPDAIRPGIQFSAKVLLRLAIVLFGVRLDLALILHQGLGLLARDIGTVAGAILVTLLVARWLKADRDLSLMLGVGTGVCGAAAIAAVSPLIKAREEDTAIAVGIIALTGTVFTIVYTLLRPLLPLTALQYGTWAGVSLHEIAHVVAGAAPAGQDALALALLAKLGRVLLLIPLCFIIIYWMRSRASSQGSARIEFPWFLVGFIAASIIRSYLPIPKAWLDAVTTLSTFLLTSAMVGLGLNVSLQALRAKALKPLLAMLTASVVLSVVTYLTIV